MVLVDISYGFQRWSQLETLLLGFAPKQYLFTGKNSTRDSKKFKIVGGDAILDFATQRHVFKQETFDEYLYHNIQSCDD